ncbi:hypothetical protein ABW19_dt0201323 [Dactylella cylindrospora]|nr:hypothetical protein ABW19_dt0201323 [Dactylella cylindrospora]
MNTLGKVWSYIGGASSQPNTPQKDSRFTLLDEESGSGIDLETEETDIDKHESPLVPHKTKMSPTKKVTKKGSRIKVVEGTPDILDPEETVEKLNVDKARSSKVESSGVGNAKRKRAEGDGQNSRKKKRQSDETQTMMDAEPPSVNGFVPINLPDQELTEETPVENIQDVIQETPKKAKQTKAKKHDSRAHEAEQHSQNSDFEIAIHDPPYDPAEDREATLPLKSPRTPQTKSPRAPRESSSRRRPVKRLLTPPPVIIPAATEGGHTNSKGVAAPPPQAAYDKGSYTPEEDAIIHSVVDRYCAIQIPRLTRAEFIKLVWLNDRHKTDFWNILMTNLTDRSRSSLYSHVRRLYNDFPERATWTPDQDKELARLVKERGTKWTLIGFSIHRMPDDCRDRWRNYLVCGDKMKKEKWSLEEEQKFLQILDDMLDTLVKMHDDNGTTVLARELGETEDERKKRLQEERAFHRDEIDWGVVSEKMGRERSRLQCSVKAKQIWSRIASTLEIQSVKKPKRVRGEGEGSGRRKKRKEDAQVIDHEDEEEVADSSTRAEASKMLPGDYLYIMRQISVQGYDCLASIDWNKISTLDTVKHFTPEQFKAGFHRYMADNNPSKKDLRSFVAQQLEEMQDLPAMQRNKRYRPPPSTVQATQAPQQEKPKKIKGNATEDTSTKPTKPTKNITKPTTRVNGTEVTRPTNPYYDRDILDLIDEQIGKKKRLQIKQKAVHEAQTPDKLPQKQRKPRSPRRKIISPETIEDSDDDDEAMGDANGLNGEILGDEIEDSDSQETRLEVVGDGGSQADDEM